VIFVKSDICKDKIPDEKTFKDIGKEEKRFYLKNKINSNSSCS